MEFCDQVRETLYVIHICYGKGNLEEIQGMNLSMCAVGSMPVAW